MIILLDERFSQNDEVFIVVMVAGSFRLLAKTSPCTLDDTGSTENI